MEAGLAPSIHNVEKRFTALFPPAAAGILANGILEALVISFHASAAMFKPTEAEKRRRVTILMDWACTLRGDFKWGVQRIVDAMPEILRTELSGAKWQPSKRQCWIPGDGR